MSDTITGKLTINGATYLITGERLRSGEDAAPPRQSAPSKPRMATNAATAETTVSFSRYGTKAGDNAKGSWVKFSALGSDGNWYATFSETIGARLKELSGCGDAVLATYTENQYGRTIESLDDEVKGPAAVEKRVDATVDADDDSSLPF